MLTAAELSHILASSRSIHRSGSMSVPALLSLAKHLQARTVRYSAETGTGASTLLFSHLSTCHEVFAVNSDESIDRVLSNPLLKRDVISFIEGPSQKTLPTHTFRAPLQAVLIDGPHAYPFPELEYFYLYPHIEPAGLLVVDDIHIPTIHNLFRYLRKEDMFHLLEVRGKTAFFQRTEAPLFDPWGDGWWLQGCNKGTLLRYSWSDRLKGAIPERWRQLLRGYLDRIRLRHSDLSGQ
jgi:hypothetical protein